MKKLFNKKTAAIAVSIALVAVLSVSAIAAPAASITAEQAKQTALNHAKLTASEVIFIKTKLDNDDGVRVYDVEFKTDNKEYDYEINAVTGKVVDCDVEYTDGFVRRLFSRIRELFKVKKFESVAPKAKSEASVKSDVATNEVTVEEAKAIALKDAGLSADKVSFIKAKVDYDDGRKVYDVEFVSGNKEYDYEIDARNGKIVDRDWDIENHNGKPADKVSGERAPAVETPKDKVPAVQSPAEKITADEAKRAALAHAGLDASTVRGLKAELDRDDGRIVYEVEFEKGAVEYEYEIDASTGKVIKAEKERDD